MRILLATDGSESANTAAEALSRFPLPRDAEVRVLTVVAPPPPVVDPNFARELQLCVVRLAETALTEAAASLRNRFAYVETRIAEGEAREEILNDMNRMLGFVEKLNELDTENVEPLIYMTDEKNVLRPDEPEVTIGKDDALKNAPDRDSDYFKAPKVIYPDQIK